MAGLVKSGVLAISLWPLFVALALKSMDYQKFIGEEAVVLPVELLGSFLDDRYVPPCSGHLFEGKVNGVA